MKRGFEAVWHALCLPYGCMNGSIESVRRQNPRSASRITVEGLLIALLLAGIICVLALPSNASWRVGVRGGSVFQMTEADFLQPKFASARAIQALNRLTGGVATFGGYDEFTSCVRLHDGVSIANITRIAGETLSVLNVPFILRSTEKQSGRSVFISEGFWERAFERDPGALGSTFLLYGLEYRIAGITRETTSLLAKTEIWLPIAARGILGESPCLRVIGLLREDLGWGQAQKQFINSVRAFRMDFLEDLLATPRLIPLDRGIYFGSPAREWIAQFIPNSAKRAG